MAEMAIWPVPPSWVISESPTSRPGASDLLGGGLHPDRSQSGPGGRASDRAGDPGGRSATGPRPDREDRC